jgi:hypothetical protein
VEDQKLKSDVAEGQATGAILRDKTKLKSSPFLVKSDVTMTEMHTTMRDSYQGVQIPVESRGKRGDV